MSSKHILLELLRWCKIYISLHYLNPWCVISEFLLMLRDLFTWRFANIFHCLQIPFLSYLSIFLLYLWVFSCHTCKYITWCHVPEEPKKKYQIPWTWSNRRLRAGVWMLRTELGSSARTVSANNNWTSVLVSWFLASYSIISPWSHLLYYISSCWDISDTLCLSWCGGLFLRGSDVRKLYHQLEVLFEWVLEVWSSWRTYVTGGKF